MINSLIDDILKITSKLEIPTILIGGLALPAYNVARSTLDIDICIYVQSQKELDDLIENFKKNDIETRQKPKIHHDLFFVFGSSNEAEIWLKPCDAFGWDDKMLDKTRNFQDNFDVLAIEDFILTKIARTDRTSTDINDILQILIANKNKIDWKYLRYRLEWVGLTEDFKEILNAFSLKLDPQYKELANSILKRFKENKN
ncbi:MAG: hypothetical protein EU541_05300 [Promethearchaeota archaeon]|nr:MAG: hypothetical protein EU541_05300 [Candidatus Lokiarchaeota archaeon]